MDTLLECFKTFFEKITISGWFASGLAGGTAVVSEIGLLGIVSVVGVAFTVAYQCVRMWSIIRDQRKDDADRERAFRETMDELEHLRKSAGVTDAMNFGRRSTDKLGR